MTFNFWYKKAFQAMIDRERLKPENTDVRPYQVDDKTYLCEISNGINQ